MKKKKIISFYSNAASQGLRTLSLAFSNLLAEQNYNVLYVELDTNNPLIAKAFEINTGKQDINSYLEQTVKGDFDSLPNYILTKKQIVENADRNQKKLYSAWQEDISYLIFPKDIDGDSVPDLLNDSSVESDAVEEFVVDYMNRFVETLQAQDYDFIVCKLSNDIDQVFSLQMMKHSHHIVSVVTPSVTKLLEQQKVKSFLFEQDPVMKDKWLDVLNMASDEVPQSEYKEVIKTEHIIPFDPLRQLEEFALQTDSNLIRSSLVNLVRSMEIQIQVSTNEKQSFIRGILSGR